MSFLLDTNVISELTRPVPERKVVHWMQSVNERLLFLSVLTIGEIRSGISSLPTGRRRAVLENWLEADLRLRFDGRILPIDYGVAARWGVLRARAAAAGRPIPVINGLLAATALHHHFTFVTRNIAHVDATGVHVLDPWS